MVRTWAAGPRLSFMEGLRARGGSRGWCGCCGAREPGSPGPGGAQAEESCDSEARPGASGREPEGERGW